MKAATGAKHATVRRGASVIVNSATTAGFGQNQIAQVFTAIAAKEQAHQRKRASLTALFRTLLHQLMTAQIRVGSIGIGMESFSST